MILPILLLLHGFWSQRPPASSSAIVVQQLNYTSAALRSIPVERQRQRTLTSGNYQLRVRVCRLESPPAADIERVDSPARSPSSKVVLLCKSYPHLHWRQQQQQHYVPMWLDRTAGFSVSGALAAQSLSALLVRVLLSPRTFGGATHLNRWPEEQ